MPSLWKHPNSKYWSACITMSDGTRTKRSTKKVKRSEAMAVCLEWQRTADLARQGTLTEVQARKVVSEIYERSTGVPLEFISTQKFLRDWITSKELTRARGTAQRYKKTVEDFLKMLGTRAEMTIAAIQPKDIERFRNAVLAQGKSAASVNLELKTLRVPFNVARRQGLILSNPAEAVDLLENDSASRDAFNHDQVAALLKEADPEWKGLIQVGCYTGLRLGDAKSLTWKISILSAGAFGCSPASGSAVLNEKSWKSPCIQPSKSTCANALLVRVLPMPRSSRRYPSSR